MEKRHCLIKTIYRSHSFMHGTIKFQIPLEMSNTRDIMAHYILAFENDFI